MTNLLHKFCFSYISLSFFLSVLTDFDSIFALHVLDDGTN